MQVLTYRNSFSCRVTESASYKFAETPGCRSTAMHFYLTRLQSNDEEFLIISNYLYPTAVHVLNDVVT